MYPCLIWWRSRISGLRFYTFKGDEDAATDSGLVTIFFEAQARALGVTSRASLGQRRLAKDRLRAKVDAVEDAVDLSTKTAYSRR